MLTDTRPQVKGSPIRVIYRVEDRDGQAARLYATQDGRIWLGLGSDCKSYELVGFVDGAGWLRSQIMQAAGVR